MKFKKPKFFSFIGFSFKSMYSNPRRSISIGAGMILGAAIFSSIFFYGSIINTITVQDMIENVEAEVAFKPTLETNLGISLAELAYQLANENEFEDSIVTYGRHFHYDILNHRNRNNAYFVPNFNFSEYAGFQVKQPEFEPMIIDSLFLNNSIVDRINIVAGVNDLSNDGILLPINTYKDLGVQLNDTLEFKFLLNRTIEESEIIVTSAILNLTVRGFFQPGLLLDDDFFIVASHNLNSSIIQELTFNNVWQLPTKLDLSEFPLNNLLDFNEYINIVINRKEQAYLFDGRNLIDDALFAYQGLIITMQMIDTVLYIPAIVLSIILIGLGADLALRERKFEVSVLKAQGASPKQIRSMIYTEVILIALIGEAIGIFLGTFGAAMVLSTYKFMSIDFPTISSAYSSLSIKPWTIITTFIVTMGILFLTTRKKTNSFIQQEVAVAKTVEKEKKNWFRMIYGDVIFFIVGLVGVLLTILENTNPDISYGFGVVLLQIFAPMLFWFGGSSIVSRLSIKVPEKLDKILVKIFKDIGVLLKGSLSRRHQNFPRLTVLLCLSVSLSVFVVIQGETGSEELIRRADYNIGGDMRVDLLGNHTSLSKTDFVGYEDMIETVIPIYYTFFYVGSTPIICYGVDLDKYGDYAIWHTDSIEKYPNWKEGLQEIQKDPLKNVGVGVETARILNLRNIPTFNFSIYNQTRYQLESVITIDHAPGGIADLPVSLFGVGDVFDFIEFEFVFAMLVDKEFVFAYAPFTYQVTRAIIRLKPGVDPVDENLAFKFNSQFEWIVYAQSYEEELDEIRQREGLRFGFPGLLTINYLIALISIVIGISIFMFMIINQRKKEFAVLISEGASRGQLIKLVLSEVFSMALFATVFGTFIGFVLGYQFNGFFDVFSFSTINRKLIFPPVILIATIIGAFLIIIFSTLIPAIIASRTNVVEEMRTF
jgi:ABC-type antimicrobial peptide transport system permease subunit